MDELNQSDGTSAGTSLASSSQMPSCVVSSHGNHTSNQKRSSVSRSGEMSQERSTSEEQGSLSKEPNYMLEWRKWRRGVANDSDRGQRPLRGDSWCSNGLRTENAVNCCKHGRKCSEYFEEMSNRLPSLWPTSLFISFESSTKADVNLSSSMENLAEADVSPMEILCRYYLGQKTRANASPKPLIAQNFRLYHKIPEDLSDLDNLTPLLNLYIVFVTNDLSLRHFRIKELPLSQSQRRRIYVECGDRNPPIFCGLQDLIWHYSTTYAYIDKYGKRSRFPN